MDEGARERRFREIALPHLDAAYDLARWLMHDAADAEDMVQDAYLRAFRYFDGFAGDNGRAWLLSIVRRVCYDGLRRRGAERREAAVDIEALDANGAAEAIADGANIPDPETSLIRQRDRELLDRLIAALPPPYREVLVLRELEQLSYRDIADIACIPLGTVMSRLARARGMLQKAWHRHHARESGRGL